MKYIPYAIIAVLVGVAAYFAYCNMKNKKALAQKTSDYDALNKQYLAIKPATTTPAAISPAAVSGPITAQVPGKITMNVG